MDNSKKFKNNLIELKDFLFLWKVFYKNLGLIILLPITTYVIGYIYTYRLNDIYGAEAQLLLKSNETYDYQDPIYKGLGAYSTYTDIQNQIRILNSRNLIGEVIDKLDFNVSQFVVGRLRRQEVFYTLPFKCDVIVLDQRFYETPISISILDANSYELKYDFENQEYVFEGQFDKELLTKEIKINLSKLYGFDSEGLSIITKSNYEIIVHTRDYLISKYQSNISVENIDFTSILNISITDELSSRGLVFLDSLCNTYVDYSRRVQLEVNQNTLDNIQKQIDTIQRFIEKTEIEILNYKENNSILDIDKEGSQYFNEYFDLNQMLREFEEQKSSIQLLEKYISSQNEQLTLPPYFYIEKADNYLSIMISELRAKQSSLEAMKTQVSENNLGYKNARSEIQSLKVEIRSYLDNLKEAIQIKINQIYIDISGYKNKITQLPKSAQDILNIQRELDVNTKMYLFLLEKKTNTLITRAGIIPQVRIIEEPRSIGIVRPDKHKIKLISLLIGLICALFIATIRIIFFEKVENVKELNELTDLSIIGGIPLLKQDLKNGIIVLNNPKSGITESFRTIRTNLTFMGSESNHGKVILISSFFPGEGKTFTSSNLASILASSEKKVLVIDFDLHKPKLHKMFEISNLKGNSTNLTGLSEIQDTVVNSGQKYLDIITAGPLAPNPSDIILSNRVNNTIEWAKSNYDFVILDTPPFGLLNDSIALSKYADIFIVLANSRILRKRGISAIEEILAKVSSKEKGIILNGIKQSKLNYYYSKYVYKYSYRYAYGYGYESYNEYGYGDDPE